MKPKIVESKWSLACKEEGFRWVGLKKLTWQDRSGKERLWECAKRVHLPEQQADMRGSDGILHLPS